MRLARPGKTHTHTHQSTWKPRLVSHTLAAKLPQGRGGDEAECLLATVKSQPRSFSHIHRLQSEGTVAFLFSGNTSALQKLHKSEKQGRQKQQHRVKRGGGGKRDAVSMRISALTQTVTVSTRREKENLFDVVCSQRLGGFSLSHAHFGHRLAECAAH